MKTIKLPLLLGAIMITAASCKKEETPEPVPIPPSGYAVPTTYNFSNVSYSGQTARILMLDSLSSYMKKANNGALLDAIVMKNMYSNTGNPFNNATLDNSGKQLKNKTYSADQTYFDSLFDSVAVTSQSATNVGSNGVAGVVTSNDGTKKYLFNRNGIQYDQLIKKHLMGAVFYYQAVETYLANIPTNDNATVVTGEGTVMEHSCDEAFGYLGVPIDFPTNISGLKYWGSYTNQVNAAISSNSPLMNAFLKLRAAISNKDYTTRDVQIIVVREQWERVVAAAAILELTDAKDSFADDAIRNTKLSEALGFIYSLKYNSNKKISQTQIDAAVTALGSNFYNISIANIDSVINTINSVYNFDLTKF
jgi:hypothetical protein